MINFLLPYLTNFEMEETFDPVFLDVLCCSFRLSDNMFLMEIEDDYYEKSFSSFYNIMERL